MRPRISDDLAEKITQQADGRLSDSPVDAEELKFNRKLEIVFEAASDRIQASDDGTELSYDDDSDDEGTVEALIDDRLE